MILNELKPLGNPCLSHLRPTKVDRFCFGAPYYPEHWDRKTREKGPEHTAKMVCDTQRDFRTH
jgi:hypothetical protein